MVTLAIGTEKGAFLLRGRHGEGWDVEGPLLDGWHVTAFGAAPDGTYLAGTASSWYGPAVQRSTDLSEWEQVVDGPSYDGHEDRTLNQVWTFHTAGERVFAGVDEAGLFVSEDDGLTWDPVAGLNDHATRPHWSPGAGGLCAHHVLTSGDRVWVGISAVGVFHSSDGGESFDRRDQGVVPAQSVADGADMDSYCVHGLVADPDDPDRIWRQDHRGVYRTSDGGGSWERIEEGLPAGFGFPITRDHASGRLFVVPLHSDQHRRPVEGRFRVYRSDDDGDSWEPSGTGMPDDPTYTIVLRGAMRADQRGGIHLGTTAGDVWSSGDNGETWERLPGTYPRILAVHAFD